MKLSGWGSSLSPCTLGEDSAALWCRRHQHQDVTVKWWVPLPKIIRTVTHPTGHDVALHDAISQQIMAHKFFKEHLADLCSFVH